MNNSGSSSSDPDSGGKVGSEGGADGRGFGREEKRNAGVALADLMLEEEEREWNGFPCRICHLESDLERAGGSELIPLGCGCKGELGTAHRHCGEAWFKLRGNRHCEICGIIAKNIVSMEDGNFVEDGNANGMALNSVNRESEGCYWKDQSLCKLLMVCLVIALVLPWLIRVSMF